MKTFILIAILVIGNITQLFSQIGTLDPGFGTNGKVHANYVAGHAESARCQLILPDGKIIIGGRSTSSPGLNDQFLLAKYNADGSFDNSFGTNGFVSGTFGTICEINKLALQSDGKIVASVYSSTNDIENMTVFRFNSDGTFDNSFGTNGKVELDFTMVNTHSASSCYDVLVQPDGKILLGGYIDSSIQYVISSAINRQMAVVRLNTNGSLDSSFSDNGYIRINSASISTFGKCIALLPNGDIILAGLYIESTYGLIFTKIHSNGTLDAGYGINGIAKFSPIVNMSYNLYDIDVMDNGDVIAVADYGNNLVYEQSILVKMKSNGVPDIYFGTTGYQTFNFGSQQVGFYCVLVQPNNQFIIAGSKQNGGYFDFMSMRLFANGITDGSWGTNGVLITNMYFQHDVVASINVQPDGKILMSGSEWNTSYMSSVSLCRYNTDMIPQTSLISPANFTSNLSSNVVLKWNLDTVSLLFEVEYSTDSLFAGNNGLINVLSDSLQLSLNPATTYYWRVRGWRFNQTGVWSSTWRFTTAPLPVIPGNTISNPILISLPYNQIHSTATGSGYTSNYTGTYQQNSPDIFFQFTTGPCADSILFSTCGSTFDTYIHLLDQYGNHIYSNDDYGPSCPGIPSSMLVHVQPNTTYYAVLEGYANYTGQAPVQIQEIDANCGTTLNLKLFLQGYYSGFNQLRPALMNENVSTNNFSCDSIEVELRSASASNQVAASCKVMLKTNGEATCNFPVSNGNFYIVVKHRNSVETWSANPITMSAITNYDFTSAANKAYGSNQSEVESGVWAFYSGDINQDENVDLLDASLLETDINDFAFGYYASDINGDGNVDLLDSPVVETNINQFVFSSHP